ncbi:hypothetical protein HY772_04795 [Candidatus Woesearchaeota archaeon]|nr:hypothetical protein [Candidatus Woesearchaeota archaeon]
MATKATKELMAQEVTPGAAMAKLVRAAEKAGVTNIDIDYMVVNYEVTVTGKCRKKYTGKPSTDYAAAFASALSKAKVNADAYIEHPEKYPVTVTAKGCYAVTETGAPYREPARGGTPAGAEPAARSGRKLTDLF